MKNSDGCFAAIVILLIGLPLDGVLYAYAAELNWNWFATALGAPRIGFGEAYGLGLVVSSFTHASDSKSNEDEIGTFAVKFFAVICARFGILAGLGWAAHSLMTP
jgi:hypothetical protein